MLKSTVRALQDLLDHQRVLSLAVIADGVPYAGLLPFVALPARNGVLVHASRLSRHTQGLSHGARVGVLLHEQDTPEKDPLQVQRVTFECVVMPLERKSEAWTAGRERYLQKFPDSRITFNLGDFTLYQLEFQHGLYVAGFGRAMDVSAADIRRLTEVSGTNV
jgi:putative heme iron utilization protein